MIEETQRWSEVRLPLPHNGQWKILNSPARFRVVACGRRFGKTEVGKFDLLITVADGGHGWWVSPTYRMALDVWRYLLNLLEPIAAHVDRTNRAIIFQDGGILEVKSAHEPDKLRGAGLDAVVIDEAAFCAEEVWHVLRPALSDKRGSALFLSTPRGHNWFWRIYQQGRDPLQPDWAAWRMPTRRNELIPVSEIEAAQRDLPARMFQQEYEAEFLEDHGAVFRGVLDCVYPDVPPQTAAEPVCFGLDWGRVNDYTVVAVLGMQSRRLFWLDRFTGMTWAAQRARIKRLAQHWNPEIILAEANSIGSPNIEALQSDGLPVRPFTMTAQSKGTLIDDLALAIEDRAIALLNDPVLIGELQAYEMDRLPSGIYKYNAPSGGHDDTVIALALAWRAAGMSRIARIRVYA